MKESNTSNLFTVSFRATLMLAVAAVVGACSGFESPTLGVVDKKGGSAPDPACMGLQEICGSSVKLSWVPPVSKINGAPLDDLMGYKIYFGTASATYSTVIDFSDPNGKEKDLTGFAPGNYYFAVSAVNLVGESPKSNEAAACLKTCINKKTGQLARRVMTLEEEPGRMSIRITNK
jgi:hypothetical protein